MGIHPEGPSDLLRRGKRVSLAALIAEDPVLYLGETARSFGTLPFLFKLLAAAKPLSIQAHPNLEQAGAGWDRENREGIPLGDPRRNYKDPNHKPEILCALSPFTAMCGFREPEQIKRGLDCFAAGSSAGAPGPVRKALGSLQAALDTPDLRRFLTALFGLPRAVREALSGHALSQDPAPGSAFGEERRLSAGFAALYPGDPAILAPFYLNLLRLAPGEAIYLPAGILHAYVYGFGVELMANSDNVLRGGLTPKHVDLEELIRVLRFEPFAPAVLRPGGEALFTYPGSCEEFSLSRMTGSGGGTAGGVAGGTVLSRRGPTILVVTQGKAVFNGGELVLGTGESAFIPAGQNLSISGSYTLYLAGPGREGGSGGP
jgi:mannose-6-phosphate isomerase